jgi:hypothetical protein
LQWSLADKEGNVITFQFGLASSLIWYDMIGCQQSATRLKFDQNNRLAHNQAAFHEIQSTFSHKMATGQKLYPRATIKKIVKAHSKKNVSKNVDVLVSSARRDVSTVEDHR